MKRVSIEKVLKILTYLIGFEIFIFSYKNVSINYLFISLIIFIIAFYKDFFKHFHINRTLLNIIAVIFIILIFLRITLQDIITPALDSLLVLLSIKFIEDKDTRDYLQILLISILVFTGATIFSFDISFIFYFLFFIFLLNLTIVFLTYFSSDKKINFKFEEIFKISYKTTLIPIFSIPLTILLFFTLPRTSTPIFNFFGSTLTARSGFTENVKLGNVSEIQEDDSIIFRVSMKVVNEEELYWRGLTLEFFEGNEWSDIDTPNIETKIKMEGEVIYQTIYLEPYSGNYFFGLDKPIGVFGRGNIYKKSDLTFFSKEIIGNRQKYEVKSILTPIIYEENFPPYYYLQLPNDLSKEIKDLSLQFKDKDDLEVAKKVENYFKNGDFKYTLKNLPISNKPIDAFLFKYKQGNCEYFATSMAIILRVLGIPTRVVAGYKGGIYNDLGKYYIVRQSDAHLWVEAYIEKIGWIRFDPTPGALREEVLSTQKKISKFRIFLDTINYYYNTFIINYDLEKQITMLNKIREGFKKPHIKISFNKKYILVLIIIFIVVLIPIFSKEIFKKNSFENKIMISFYNKMRKLGIIKKKEEGLEEFLNRIENSDLRNRIEKFVKNFEEYYYRDKRFEKKDYIYFKNLLKEI